MLHFSAGSSSQNGRRVFFCVQKCLYRETWKGPAAPELRFEVPGRVTTKLVILPLCGSPPYVNCCNQEDRVLI
jgi:hypothetical protein